MASKKYIELQEFTIDELKNELTQTEVQYQNCLLYTSDAADE